MVDLRKLIERMLSAIDAADFHMRGANESMSAVRLISAQIAKHPHIGTLSPDETAVLAETLEKSSRINNAFAEIYGQIQ
jgi:hypothetical protein